MAKLQGIVDVQITVDSWNYLMDFLVLKTKAQPSGYPVILGRPWLATVALYINYCFGDMTISHGHNTKTLSLYPPAQ